MKKRILRAIICIILCALLIITTVLPAFVEADEIEMNDDIVAVQSIYWKRVKE